MTWTRVADAAEVREKGVVGVACAGGDIALYWVGGEVYATADTCTHAAARLSEGFLDGECIECPVHQALFNVKSGEAVEGPASDPVKTYPCRVDGHDVWIDI